MHHARGVISALRPSASPAARASADWTDIGQWPVTASDSEGPAT